MHGSLSRPRIRAGCREYRDYPALVEGRLERAVDIDTSRRKRQDCEDTDRKTAMHEGTCFVPEDAECYLVDSRRCFDLD